MFYLCDPDKNTECSKGFACGTECMLTTKKECAKNGYGLLYYHHVMKVIDEEERHRRRIEKELAEKGETVSDAWKSVLKNIRREIKTLAGIDDDEVQADV